jgi:hypothetical protein
VDAKSWIGSTRALFKQQIGVKWAWSKRAKGNEIVFDLSF